jgi:phage tail sheath protein FI
LCEDFGTQTVFADKIFTTFGTYSCIAGNMKYQYDKFNDVNRWVSVLGDIAGLYAQTDQISETWYAPAGSTRGVIKNCIKLAFNPNKQNRDNLYQNAINPIMSVAGEGSAVVYGQKTATSIPSAMDHVNVRRLLIVLEKTIAISVRFGLFEFNDSFTQNRLYSVVDQYLRSVKAKRGLIDFKVVCDSTNNTPFVIDQNALVMDIYLKPAKAIDTIALNVFAVPTGVKFEEIIGKV